ncbi:MAG: hypothetical protein WCR67_06565 [Bacilli bacterium]
MAKAKKEKKPFNVRFKQFQEESKAEIKRSKASFIVFLILAISVIGMLIRSLITRNYENSASCVLVLILFSVPSFIERHLNIDIPIPFEIIILVFIYAAQILGEMNSFYIKFPWWDTMLHTINGFLFAAVGFALCDIINQNANIKFKLSPLFLSVVAFCFSMTIGVLWEFFEFGMDKLFLFDMQKDTLVTQFASVYFDATNSNIMVKVVNIGKTIIYDTDGNVLQTIAGGYLDIGITDTMEDLFVNLIGAVVFSIFGFLYVKSRGQNKLASHFIPTLKTEKEMKAIENPKTNNSNPTTVEAKPKIDITKKDKKDN